MSGNNLQKINIKISGDVQGVLYRYSAVEKAQELGLFGWVKNTSNGRVEVVAEGSKDSLEEFIKWCRQGPSFAKVNNIEVSWEKYKGEYATFEIKF